MGARSPSSALEWSTQQYETNECSFWRFVQHCFERADVSFHKKIKVIFDCLSHAICSTLHFTSSFKGKHRLQFALQEWQAKMKPHKNDEKWKAIVWHLNKLRVQLESGSPLEIQTILSCGKQIAVQWKHCMFGLWLLLCLKNHFCSDETFENTWCFPKSKSNGLFGAKNFQCTLQNWETWQSASCLCVCDVFDNEIDHQLLNGCCDPKICVWNSHWFLVQPPEWSSFCTMCLIPKTQPSINSVKMDNVSHAFAWTWDCGQLFGPPPCITLAQTFGLRACLKNIGPSWGKRNVPKGTDWAAIFQTGPEGPRLRASVFAPSMSVSMFTVAVGVSNQFHINSNWVSQGSNFLKTVFTVLNPMCECSGWPKPVLTSVRTTLSYIGQTSTWHCSNAHNMFFQCRKVLFWHLLALWQLHRCWRCALVHVEWCHTAQHCTTIPATTTLWDVGMSRKHMDARQRTTEAVMWQNTTYSTSDKRGFIFSSSTRLWLSH